MMRGRGNAKEYDRCCKTDNCGSSKKSLTFRFKHIFGKAENTEKIEKSTADKMISYTKAKQELCTADSEK